MLDVYVTNPMTSFLRVIQASLHAGPPPILSNSWQDSVSCPNKSSLAVLNIITLPLPHFPSPFLLVKFNHFQPTTSFTLILAYVEMQCFSDCLMSYFSSSETYDLIWTSRSVSSKHLCLSLYIQYLYVFCKGNSVHFPGISIYHINIAHQKCIFVFPSEFLHPLRFRGIRIMPQQQIFRGLPWPEVLWWHWCHRQG